MRPNEIALSKVDAPGNAVTGRPPASVSQGSAMPGSGIGPVPMRPFSDWKKTWIPFGTKLATRVGMPMPRLTSMPSRSSRAMRWAMMVCGSIGSALHKVVDQGSGRDDVVGRDDADRHDIVGRDEDRVSRHGHQRVEVPSREGVGEIAKVVAQERVHERKVGPQRGLKEVRPAVNLDRAFAVLNHRADPGWRENSTEAAAADAFGQSSLRYEVHLERARHHLLLG